MRTAGKPDRESGHSAPWWTEECRLAHKRHVREKAGAGQPPSEATKIFHTEVRKAKKAYWQKRIDECTQDTDLYKLVGWHKLSYDQQDTPLIVDRETFTSPLDKVEALRKAVLDRFTADDDLPTPPPHTDDDHSPRLPWYTQVSMEEVERYVIGVTSTSPGPDRVTVRLLKVC